MSRSSRKTDRVNTEPDDFSYGPPPLSLLDDNQWRSIRKRFRMSPRELEVAKLVCIGLSNDQIAARLKIRGGTVKTHLRNVYRRIRVKRKLDMLLKFLSQSMGDGAAITNVPIAVIDPQPTLKREIRPTINDKD